MSISRNSTYQINGSTTTKAMLLIGREKVGGAEKRYGRVFLKASERDASIFLIINQVLYESLIKHGIPLDKSSNVLLIRGDYYSRASFIHMVLSGLRLYYSVSRLIKRNNISQLHSMGFLILLNALLFVRQKNLCKGISLFDSTLDRNLNSGLLRSLFKCAVRRSDYLDILSEDIKKSFSKRYGNLFKGKYYVAPCSFVDYSRCEPAGVTKKNHVVFVGRLIKDKNPVLFLRAIPTVLQRLGRRCQDITFYIVGEGPLLESLEGDVERLGIQKHVNFEHSYTPEKILCGSRIFVSLQAVNNYPSQSLIEAMACENAVVATDVGETWKLVDETTGIRVGQNSESIAAAIVDLFAHPEKLERLGKNARERVLREHTIERYVDYFTRCISDQ